MTPTSIEALDGLRKRDPEVFDAVVKILNVSILAGYRPVVTTNENDGSLEVEARLSSGGLLIFQVVFDKID